MVLVDGHDEPVSSSSQRLLELAAELIRRSAWRTGLFSVVELKGAEGLAQRHEERLHALEPDRLIVPVLGSLTVPSGATPGGLGDFLVQTSGRSVLAFAHGHLLEEGSTTFEPRDMCDILVPTTRQADDESDRRTVLPSRKTYATACADSKRRDDPLQLGESMECVERLVIRNEGIPSPFRVLQVGMLRPDTRIVESG